MTDEVLFEIRGRAGFITLNRSAALNALTLAMVRAMAERLDAWARDDSIAHVVVRGAGGKAFCAGGDIRRIYEMGKAGDPHQVDFFAEEYRLNAQIKAFSKPYVSLIDGIVMGGGVGISVHGSHRLGTERLTFAMPETGIGFFPDVGGTYVLPRMPRASGIWCALTAGRMKQADALWSGVLTHAVHAADLDAIETALAEAADVDAALAPFAADPGPAPILDTAEEMEAAFSRDSLAGILAALQASGSDFAVATLKTLAARSPTSVAIAFEQMRRGRNLDFAGCMRLEFRIVNRILREHDFYEGVRAVLIDKDNAPRWRPSSFDAVDSAALAAYFEEPACGDLVLAREGPP
ncbi:enoyl-CoA hydratase/isomerase family protein [Polymorphum gilvum]|uniref:3-hydroxyisobutyryl-CoA hydrolase n=1 Tax=Polymorphum gilvum (strain LMG 25793 / CGMCC 1.9160 / SL003B-26A1) TaxID=991905 RepID=F2IWL1_POLGS|nr:enoyl-CoA hydratase/isomerase family protein [Polymorphum gilvum]ADZ70336.1 Enoyl-CoA hydratase/isomerase family protein [Polymorphum gilvum SL003B-26A1]